MERTDVLKLYDEPYAAAYDERFLLAMWPKEGADYEASVLRRLLSPGDRWLDIGCGTGYFLGLFPDVERAGIDISPAMLERARAANPDALFLREADFRDPVPEWDGAWSLVSCMWTAYNYVQSVWEVEQVVENMARWTAPGGSVFIPVMDLEDLRPHTVIPYEESPDVWGGSIAITSFTWTWDEPGNDKVHEHLVAPHVDHFVELLSPHFRRVEVVRYPKLHPGWVSRKAVLATGRRPAGETGTAEVVHHPVLPHPDEEEPVPPATEPAPPAAEAAATAHPARPASLRLSAVPTRRLLREAFRRVDPRRPGFGARVKREVGARVRRALD